MFQSIRVRSEALSVLRSVSFCFSLSVSLQGSIGKAGVPGEIGLQGFPVSVTFNLNCQGSL